MTLLVIMDPIGTVPLFLALTSGRSRKVRAPAGLAGSGRGDVRHRGVRVVRAADPALSRHLGRRRCKARVGCC